MTEYAMPSTGDPEEDERQINQFRLHEERMRKNMCPNGCGYMKVLDANNRECEKCHFACFSTKPFDFDGASA